VRVVVAARAARGAPLADVVVDGVVVAVSPAVAVLALRLLYVWLSLSCKKQRLITNLKTQNDEPEAAVPTNVPGQAVPLTEAATENEIAAKEAKIRAPRVQKQRGPPEDGIPSKTKVMVANLPYDLNEEKVR
jgi:hypothetical protein